MAMSPRLLRPRASGATHPEAADWATRVVTNGGTVRSSTLAAVSKFCAAISAAGLRDRFYRLNLFCGNSDASLNAVRTPLYRGLSLTGSQLGNATDTNVNFAEGDYAETGSSGGLKGNGSTKHLNTGLTFTSAPVATISLSAYAAEMETTATNAAMVLVGALAGANFHGAALNAAWNFGSLERRCDLNGNSGLAVPRYTSGLLAAAHLSASNTSGDNYSLYENGISKNSVTQSTGTATNNPNGPLLVFCRASANSSVNPIPFSYSAARIRAYHIGRSMTDAQQLAFYNAMHAIQTALGRQVRRFPTLHSQ